LSERAGQGDQKGFGRSEGRPGFIGVGAWRSRPGLCTASGKSGRKRLSGTRCFWASERKGGSSIHARAVLPSPRSFTSPAATLAAVKGTASARSRAGVALHGRSRPVQCRRCCPGDVRCLPFITSDDAAPAGHRKARKAPDHSSQSPQSRPQAVDGDDENFVAAAWRRVQDAACRRRPGMR
jgi:hypothetical protein